ncbi:MAG TPA: GIY-YIG nuclease family protein [Peptococcaceae bacterium]|nr:GIY-YIG nuclease family protein [Peptococcaceae bacterium]
MDRKKELKELYKQMKPPMGVYVIRSNFSKKCFLEATNNLKGRLNSTKVKLENNFHPNRELQKDWNEHGEGSFTFEILEELEYAKDDSKTDYSDDLALLHMEWEEKMAAAGYEFYNKSFGARKHD